MMALPWQIPNIPGPMRASVVKGPGALIPIIRRAQRIVLVIGHTANETEVDKGKMVVEYALELARAGKMDLVATAHAVKEVRERGFRAATSMSLVDVVQRLGDPGWMGIDGGGNYDLAIFTGIPYATLSQALSFLKHFAPHVKTVSIDPFYQPNANWSLPNLDYSWWGKYLRQVISDLRK
ncbi:MAG: CO dehydrogenase/acetyl-CoA synthase complex subunit epsilon [Candidatus Bathyarchaeia archaeon]